MVPVHSRIALGSALEIFSILTEKVTPTTVKNNVCSPEDAKVIVLCGAYLHGIGNAVHWVNHHIHGCTIANPIPDRLLSKVYSEFPALSARLKWEILHAVFSTDEEAECLSLKAGAAKVADGNDVAEGTARIP